MSWLAPQDLQEEVQAKKEEKLKLNKQLALIKTNTDRMKIIMRTYLGSAEIKARPMLDREVRLSSQASDGDVHDLGADLLEDENEADIDSAGPYRPGRYETTETVQANLNSERGQVGELSISNVKVKNQTDTKVSIRCHLCVRPTILVRGDTYPTMGY